MTKGDMEIGVSDNEYVDDTVFSFETQEDYEVITPLIVKHFARSGFEVHNGSNGNNSKYMVLIVQKIKVDLQTQHIMMANFYLQSVGRKIFISQW